MKHISIAIILSFGWIQTYSQEENFNGQFNKLEEVLDALNQGENDKEVFDFLIKYYEDQEKIEERFLGVDNIDVPGTNREEGFKMNRMTSFNLYPNPNNGNFNIEFFGDKGELRILDSFGNLVKDQISFTKGKYEIEMSDFKKGLYYVEVLSNSTSFKRRMLIK